MVWAAEDDWAAVMDVEAVVVVAGVEGKVAGGLGVVAAAGSVVGRLVLIAVGGTEAGQLGAVAYLGHRVGRFVRCS